MRTFVFAATLVLVTLVALPVQAAADTVSVGKLLSEPTSFDGKQITISGELIGDYGFRSDGTVWAQLNDDAYALSPLREGGALHGSNVGLGIRADEGFFVAIDPPGRYNQIGPVVSVTGTWKYHDPDRGGESYLEVVSLEVVKQGRPVRESTRPLVVVTGVLLTLMASGLLFLSVSRRSSE